MTAVIGINGFGRIGRLVLREALRRRNGEVVVASINDPFMTPEYMSYLFRYDFLHGPYKGTVGTENVGGQNFLVIDGNTRIKIHTAIKDPQHISWGHEISGFSLRSLTEIPWRNDGVDIVAETSGAFMSTEKANRHLHAGAKKVVLSGPANDLCTPTFVMGVNNSVYDPSIHHIVSNASGTINCLAPLAKVVNDFFGIEEGLMTTVHAVPTHHLITDGPTYDTDWRVMRSILDDITPASSSAATTVGAVIPALRGRLSGMAFHVPSVASNISVVDLTCRLQRDTSVDEIATAILSESRNPGGSLQDIIDVVDDDFIFRDFRGETLSCIFDKRASIALNRRFFKLIAFYDNEYAYSARMVDLMVHMKQAELRRACKQEVEPKEEGRVMMYSNEVK